MTLAIIKRLVTAALLGWIAFHAAHAQARGYRHHRADHSPIAALVARSAAAHGVPVPLALAVIRVESNFNPRARNHNARGIGQVLPATARSVGIDPGRLLTLAGGLEAAMRYLALAVARHGTGCAAASAYNTGIWTRPRCTLYGRRVMSLAGRI